MTSRANLKDWVLEALTAHGGKAKIVELAKHIWDNHREELEQSGNLLYTWQYDMRWAGLQLSKLGKIALSDKVGESSWALLKK